MSRRTMRRALAAVATLAVLAALAGCATNPVTGKREVSLVGSGQEAQMGAEGYKAVVAEYGLYDDADLEAVVQRVGARVAASSHQPNQKWTFTLVDDPAVNAFAMPGGYVYITRGMMAHLQSEAQLAGVLGHEIGHVTARHSAQRITQSQLASLGLGVASIFSSGFRRYGGLAEQALGLMFLKYGRDDENEADELGVNYATKAGFDPREIPGTYATLRRVSERSGQRLPTFLSTHPDPGDRQRRTAELAQKVAAGRTGLVVNERSYLQRLDGVVYGRDPKNGYFEGTRYYHPSLRFQMGFPSGWRTQDTRSAVLAAEPNQRGVMQLTLTPKTTLSPTAYVAQLERDGQISGARGRGETISGYPAWVGQVGIRNQDGSQAVLAAAWIRRSADQMFQVLGRGQQAGDRYEAEVLASARSYRDLTDPARLEVRPRLVDVMPAPRGGEFDDVVQALGRPSIPLEEEAILNQLDSTKESVPAGTLIKLVR
jgi:predicted Zn-dependent protease